VIEDVTERKHARNDLREADRRKDEFLADPRARAEESPWREPHSLHIVRLAGSQDPAIQRVGGHDVSAR
jgi:hypothetical protein